MVSFYDYQEACLLINEVAGDGPVHRPVEKIISLRWRLLSLGDPDSLEIAEALLWAMEIQTPGIA